VKNRGYPNFQIALPEGTQLWSATVNGVSVVPVLDAKANLIPLPQRADPNAILQLELKLAARSKSPKRVSASAPIVNAPVMLAEWKLEPDTGQRLVYRTGSLTPIGGVPEVSGFAGLARMFTGTEARRVRTSVVAALLLVGIALLVWRWTLREGMYRFSVRHLSGTLLGLVAFSMAVAAFANLLELARHHGRVAPRTVTLLAPVQQAGNTLSVELANVADKASVAGFISNAWPALFALVVWVWGWTTGRGEFKPVGWLVGWLLLAWAALRWPNGAPAFLLVVLAFLVLHVMIPVLRRLWQLPRQPTTTPPQTTESGPAPAAAALLLVGFVWLEMSSTALAGTEAEADVAFPEADKYVLHMQHGSV